MTKDRKLTLFDIQNLKNADKKAVFLTAYDYPFARLAESAGVDMILVGDSLGMTTLGYDSTNPVTMDDMIRHSQAVTRAAKKTFVIGDMPFLSYQPSDRDAVVNAGRFIAEAGCDAVKCEGGRRIAPRIRAMVDAGIVVMGHIGLTPQSLAQSGGYRVQGRSLESYQTLVDDALAVQEAGGSFLLLEAVPEAIGEQIQKKLSIPVYGIGAGARVDGQLVVIHDILGLFDKFTPKFVKRYCEAGEVIQNALGQYCSEVRDGVFPGPEQCYSIDASDLNQILKF